MSDLSKVYDFLAPSPDAWYGDILPVAYNQPGTAAYAAQGANLRFAMPNSLRNALTGIVDLGNATQTGALTGNALQVLTMGGMGTGTSLAPRNSLGIFGGTMARKADIDALGVARDRLKTGSWPGEVWEGTGWGKGPDGKWRFEINDSAAAYKQPSAVRAEGNLLSDVLDHPALFEAYPELKNVRVHWSDLTGPQHYGSTDGSRQIILNSNLWADPERARISLLHEIQHIVQTKEGFAQGASATVGPDAYRRSAGEVEARNVETRANYSANKRREDPPYYTQDVPDDQLILGFNVKKPVPAAYGFRVAKDMEF